MEPGGIPELRRRCWEYNTMLLEFMEQSTKEEITIERKEERECVMEICRGSPLSMQLTTDQCTELRNNPRSRKQLHERIKWNFWTSRKARSSSCSYQPEWETSQFLVCQVKYSEGFLSQ